jgi:GNAT superfamily N-acetyltransferase
MTVARQGIDAVEANLWAMHRDFARVPGAEIHDDPHLLWFTLPSRSSWLNGASRTRVTPATADDTIRRVVDEIGGRRRHLLWHVGPSTRPVDLAARLEAAGFEGDREVSMALDLRSMPTPPERPSDLVISSARSAADLLDWLEAFDRSIEVDPRGTAHPWYEPFQHLGLDRRSPVELLVGRADGAPVACAMAFSGGGAVGLYGVMTVPSHRRRGYGSAMTAAGVAWGASRGHRFAILHATEMGEPVYRRMGFEAVGEKSQWLLVSEAT